MSQLILSRSTNSKPWPRRKTSKSLPASVLLPPIRSVRQPMASKSAPKKTAMMSVMIVFIRLKKSSEEILFILHFMDNAKTLQVPLSKLMTLSLLPRLKDLLLKMELANNMFATMAIVHIKPWITGAKNGEI